LIASEYIRVYHPVETTYKVSGTTCENREDNYLGSHVCERENSGGGCDAESLNATEDPNKWGSTADIWIYAAMLSTDNSFLVDNYACGAKLGELNVYGAVAQNYRGIVGIVGGSGYLKDYKYDERLATDEPPYFLAPLKAGWKIVRETAASRG
jgi:hypothetical protein